MVGAGEAAFELFVADATRSGRSQLLDDIAALLDEPASFVPARGAGGVLLLAKHAIAWVAIARDDSLADAEFGDYSSEVTTLYDRQHRVELALCGGGTLVGGMLDSSPADRPRVIDHLNRSGRFVRLWTSDEHYLVNKQQIVRVTELPNTLE